MGTWGPPGISGKVVVITGAARGIGADAARRLARAGAKVALVGLEPDELRRTAQSCGPDATAWDADVTSWDQLNAAVDGIVEHYGGIDVVVANAGVAPTGFIRSIDPAAFERTIEINLLGVWRTVRTALPHIIKSKGYVLVVSSAAALIHPPALAAYTASKAGAEAFGDSLRAEVKHLGVDVGVAYFSWVKTDLVTSADSHPVLGKFRKAAPGPASRVYPVEKVGQAVVAGITKRSRVICVPSWLNNLRRFHGMLPAIVEKANARATARADREMIADVEKRGAEAASRLTGPGGAAAQAATTVATASETLKESATTTSTENA
ncbi:SDR family oxidoreductase [Catenulispora pinisilvae]|uniref:SDR family oxidoreductase n=1 Tax=Catenulispora pinisilvae TaxID=2705253 RepID=UPI001E5335F6|nr:SDR family oxidoreductase [Catenulispora pinisilvae]